MERWLTCHNVVDQSVGQERHPTDPMAAAKALHGYLSVFLSAHSTKQQLAKARTAAISARRQRRQAYQLLMGLGHLLQFLQLSLSHFLPRTAPARQLSSVEVRYSVPCVSWPYRVPDGVVSCRIAVKNTIRSQAVGSRASRCATASLVVGT